MKDLFAFRYEDFTLEGYDPHAGDPRADRGLKARMIRSLVVAMARNRVIGHDNGAALAPARPTSPTSSA